MTFEEKFKLAWEWFCSAPEVSRQKAAHNLLHAALLSDIIHVWSEEDARELAEEEGKPISYYRAPYYSSCGEPIDKDWDKS